MSSLSTEQKEALKTEVKATILNAFEGWMTVDKWPTPVVPTRYAPNQHYPGAGGTGLNRGLVVEEIHRQAGKLRSANFACDTIMTIESAKYDAVIDLTSTIAAAGSDTTSRFWWPHTKETQTWLTATALHNLDPGEELRISTRDALPAWLNRAKSNAEFEFHGTIPEFLPWIIANGFAGTFGGGTWAILAGFGLPIPQIFTSNLVETAKTYPQMSAVDSTGHAHESGSPICQDGTPPLRTCIDVICEQGQHLWKKNAVDGKNHQHSWLPNDSVHAAAVRIRACTIEATQNQHLEYVAIFSGFISKELGALILANLDSWIPENRHVQFGIQAAEIGGQPGALDGFAAPPPKEEGNHPGNPYQANLGAAPTSLILSMHYLLQDGDYNEYGDHAGYRRKRMLVDKIVNRPSFILLGKVKVVDAKLLEKINAVRFHQAIVNVDTIRYFLGDADMPEEYRTNPEEWLDRHYHDHARHTGGANSDHIFVWMVGSVNQHLRRRQQEVMRHLVPDQGPNPMNTRETGKHWASDLRSRAGGPVNESQMETFRAQWQVDIAQSAVPARAEAGTSSAPATPGSTSAPATPPGAVRSSAQDKRARQKAAAGIYLTRVAGATKSYNHVVGQARELTTLPRENVGWSLEPPEERASALPGSTSSRARVTLETRCSFLEYRQGLKTTGKWDHLPEEFIISEWREHRSKCIKDVIDCEFHGISVARPRTDRRRAAVTTGEPLPGAASSTMPTANPAVSQREDSPSSNSEVSWAQPVAASPPRREASPSNSSDASWGSKAARPPAKKKKSSRRRTIQRRHGASRGQAASESSVGNASESLPSEASDSSEGPPRKTSKVEALMTKMMEISITDDPQELPKWDKVTILPPTQSATSGSSSRGESAQLRQPASSMPAGPNRLTPTKRSRESSPGHFEAWEEYAWGTQSTHEDDLAEQSNRSRPVGEVIAGVYLSGLYTLGEQLQSLDKEAVKKVYSKPSEGNMDVRGQIACSSRNLGLSDTDPNEFWVRGVLTAEVPLARIWIRIP